MRAKSRPHSPPFNRALSQICDTDLTKLLVRRDATTKALPNIQRFTPRSTRRSSGPSLTSFAASSLPCSQISLHAAAILPSELYVGLMHILVRYSCSNTRLPLKPQPLGTRRAVALHTANLHFVRRACSHSQAYRTSRRLLNTIQRSQFFRELLMDALLSTRGILERRHFETVDASHSAARTHTLLHHPRRPARRVRRRGRE